MPQPPDDEVDRVARLLMIEWERIERKPINVSYVATFADMARAVVTEVIKREREAASVKAAQGRSDRPPLDPTHVEALRGMLQREHVAQRIRERWGGPEPIAFDAESAARVAALEAVLSREAHRG